MGVFRRRNHEKLGQTEPHPPISQDIGKIGVGSVWDNRDELAQPVPDHLRESPGLDRGAESLEAIKRHFRERFGDDPDGPGFLGGDWGPSNGGGPPRPEPNLPHDPVGGGAVSPNSLIGA